MPLVAGAIVPAGAGRTIFALPWLGHTLVGTTDNDYEGPLDHVKPSGEDVGYLLEATNAFFGSTLGPADLTGAFAGVRPADLDRRPEEVGGHLAQGRAVRDLLGDDHDHRRQAHHLAADGQDDGRPAGRARRRDAPCRTHEIPLGQAITVEELPRVEGVPAESYAALASRYGYAAHQVLALAAERGELAQPIVPGLPDLLAEVALAARREQARSIGDVLLRRTRLGLLAARELLSAGGLLARVADILAGELGWSPERRTLELSRFLEEADAEGILPVGASPQIGGQRPSPIRRT